MQDPTDHMVELLTKEQLDQSARHRWTCPIKEHNDRCGLAHAYLISFWTVVAGVETQQRTRVCGTHAEKFAKRHGAVVRQADQPQPSAPTLARSHVVRQAPPLPPQPVVTTSQPPERRVSGMVPASVARRNVPDTDLLEVANR
jgi:hypothetical protein